MTCCDVILKGHRYIFVKQINIPFKIKDFILLKNIKKYIAADISYVF